MTTTTHPCPDCASPMVDCGPEWGDLRYLCTACNPPRPPDPRTIDEALADWVASLPPEQVLDLPAAWIDGTHRR